MTTESRAVEMVETACHGAFLEHHSGEGVLVLPAREQDTRPPQEAPALVEEEILLDGERVSALRFEPSLHEADLADILARLAWLGWTTERGEFGEMVEVGHDSEGRTLVALCRA